MKRFLACLSALITLTTSALPVDVSQMRADRVGWARLQTSGAHWKRHAGSDPVLAQFIRENTSLNIDPTWYAADVENLSELCKYPMLFSQGIGMVNDDAGRANLAEYIRRVDFCSLTPASTKTSPPIPISSSQTRSVY